MKIDVYRRRPELATKTGGLSGPAILPIAVRMVYQVYEAFGDRIPIVGVGGISTGEDALQHVMAGASAVQVGTANFYDPLAPLKVLKEVEEFLNREKTKLKDIIGIAHREM